MITHHPDLIQGSEEWHAARCGILTASDMKLIITPTLKAASNDKERAHVYELAAQRISRYVEPTYIGDDMLRGKDDELLARALYAKHYAPVADMGFITNDKWGFIIGCSPDGLVGDDGMIECKSRRQKYQIETIAKGEMPNDFAMQVQTALLVTERAWCDFVSYSGGLPMFKVRVFPDEGIQRAIIQAAVAFEDRVTAAVSAFRLWTENTDRLIETERRVEQEMFV
jgi:hypothetical protein